MEENDKICEKIARKHNVREEYVRLLIKICLDNHIYNIEEKINAFLSSKS